MLPFISDLILIVYFTAAGTLMVYGLNCYILIYLFLKRRIEAETYRNNIAAKFSDIAKTDDLPVVTTQIAVFNELNVAERVIKAVCGMHYPGKKHEIQVLDDSTDETKEKIDNIAAKLRAGRMYNKVL